MTKLGPDAKGGVFQTLPSSYYTREDVFTRERDIIFKKTWHLVGQQSEWAQLGDFRVIDMAGASVVVIRSEDGKLRAFHNFCIHRGHELVEGNGCQKLFTCPYHAWTYDTMGRLVSAPHASCAGFDVSGKSLKSVALKLLNGLVFLNLNDAPDDLRESLGNTADEIEEYLPNLELCVLAHRETHLLAANWKLVLENFNECYHCGVVHKHLAENLLDLGDFRLIDRGTSFLHCPFSQSDKTLGLKQNPSDQEKQATFAAWLIWPLCAVQHYPGGVAMTFRWEPLTVDQTKVVVEWWLPSATPSAYEAQLIEDHSNTTLPEDFPIVESVQRTMSAGGFERGYLLVDAAKTALSEHGVKGLQDKYRAVMGLTD